MRHAETLRHLRAVRINLCKAECSMYELDVIDDYIKRLEDEDKQLPFDGNLGNNVMVSC